MKTLELDLSLARNMLGRLPDDVKARLRRVIARPSVQTWEDAHSIIVGSNGFTTLWQAVLLADPTFPRTGRRVTLEGDVLTEWQRIPDRQTLRRALRLVTH